MLVVTDSRDVLRALDWEDYETRLHYLLRLHYGNDVELRAGRGCFKVRLALEAYYAGMVSVLDGLPVATGGTTFQRELWAALRRIPAGATSTYGRLALQLGRPKAARAVGAANGANPVGIVIPCHRVIGQNGGLTGYGGGTDRKRWLLDHEARHRGL